MPKIEISRSTTRLPRSSGFGGIGPVDFSTGAGQGLKNLGQAVSAFGQEKLEQVRLAEDSSFVADQTVRAQKRALEIQNEVRDEFGGDFKGYAEEVSRRTEKEFDEVLASSPSQRARNNLQSRLVGMRTNQLSKAMAFERQAFVTGKIETAQESLNILGEQIRTGELDYNSAKQNWAEHEAAFDTYLGAGEAAKLTSQANTTFIEAQVKALASAEGGTLGEVKQFLARKDIVSELTPNQRQLFFERAEDIVLERENKFKKDTKNQISNLTMLGEYDKAKTLLDDALEGGVLEPGSSDHRQMHNFINQGYKDYQELKAAKAFVNSALSGDSVISVEDDNQLKQYQNYWDNTYSEDFFSATPEVRQDMVTTMASAGAVPPRFRQQLEMTIKTGSPKQRALAAETLVDLADQKNGMLVRNVDDDILTEARVFQSLTQSLSGDSEEAARIIKEAEAARRSDPQVNDKVEALSKFINSNEGKKLISKEFGLNKDPFGFGKNEVPQELLTYLQQTTSQHYAIHHGHVPMQEQLQFQIENAKRTWKPVEVFGTKRLVRHGPGSEEREMSLGGERRNFQQKQIEEQVNQAIPLVFADQEPQVAADKTRSLKETMSIIPIQENGRKRYKIVYTHEGKAETLKTTDGQPFTIDVDRNREPGVILNSQIQVVRDQAAGVEKLIQEVDDRLFDGKATQGPLTQFGVFNEPFLGAIDGADNKERSDKAAKLRELYRKTKDAEKTLEKAIRGVGKPVFSADMSGAGGMAVGQVLQRTSTGAQTQENFDKVSRQNLKKAREDYAREIKTIMDGLNSLEDMQEGPTFLAPVRGDNDIKGSAGQDILGDDMSFLQKQSEVQSVDLIEASTVGRLTRMAEIGGNEHLKNKIHIPKTAGGVVGNSGVTIGVGYDLGQRSEGEIRSDLRSAGVPEDVIQDLTKFAGKKGPEAVKAMETSPVNGVPVLTDKQADKLFALKYKPKLEQADSIISSISGIDDNPTGKSMLRQALSSALYQINLPKVFPDATAQLKRGNWEAATKAMVYASRTDKSRGPSKWATQTPERILPIIVAMEEISGKELKSILLLAEGVDTTRLGQA